MIFLSDFVTEHFVKRTITAGLKEAIFLGQQRLKSKDLILLLKSTEEQPTMSPTPSSIFNQVVYQIVVLLMLMAPLFKKETSIPMIQSQHPVAVIRWSVGSDTFTIDIKEDASGKYKVGINGDVVITKLKIGTKCTLKKDSEGTPVDNIDSNELSDVWNKLGELGGVASNFTNEVDLHAIIWIILQYTLRKKNYYGELRYEMQGVILDGKLKIKPDFQVGDNHLIEIKYLRDRQGEISTDQFLRYLLYLRENRRVTIHYLIATGFNPNNMNSIGDRMHSIARVIVGTDSDLDIYFWNKRQASLFPFLRTV